MAEKIKIGIIKTWTRFLGFVLSFFGVSTFFTGCPLYGPAMLYGPPPMKQVNGTVTAATNKQPIPDIRVYVTDAADYRMSDDVMTGTDGRYTVEFNDPGQGETVYIHAEHGSYANQTLPVTINTNYFYTVDFSLD